MKVQADIYPASDGPSDALLAELRSVDLPTIGHVLESGYPTGLSRLAGSTPIAGRVVTVSLVDTDSTLVHFLTTLVRPGDFVVIDAGLNQSHAPLGGVMAASFAASGVVGVAVNGVATDIEGLRAAGISVYARGLAAVTTRTGSGPVRGGINVPVTLGGISVLPGMVAVGDENGLLITSETALTLVMPAVRAMMTAEPITMARISAGEPFGTFFLPPETREALIATTQTNVPEGLHA